MSMTRGTPIGRMVRATCTVCGQKEVAVRADGQLVAAHLRARRHVEAIEKSQVQANPSPQTGDPVDSA